MSNTTIEIIIYLYRNDKRMVNKEIKLLERQIEKLSASDFDFEAWKNIQ